MICSFLFCPFQILWGPSWCGRQDRQTCLPRMFHLALLAKGLLPVEFKFRSSEILRNSVMKGELWIFLFWKVSLLNSTKDSIQLYPHLTWETRIVTWIASSSHTVIPSFSVMEASQVPGWELTHITTNLFSPLYYFKSCLVACLPKKGC